MNCRGLGSATFQPLGSTEALISHVAVQTASSQEVLLTSTPAVFRPLLWDMHVFMFVQEEAEALAGQGWAQYLPEERFQGFVGFVRPMALKKKVNRTYQKLIHTSGLLTEHMTPSDQGRGPFQLRPEWERFRVSGTWEREHLQYPC